MFCFLLSLCSHGLHLLIKMFNMCGSIKFILNDNDVDTVLWKLIGENDFW